MDGKHRQDRDGCPDVKALEAAAGKQFAAILNDCRTGHGKFQRFEKGLFTQL